MLSPFKTIVPEHGGIVPRLPNGISVAASYYYSIKQPQIISLLFPQVKKQRLSRTQLFHTEHNYSQPAWQEHLFLMRHLLLRRSTRSS